MNALRSCLKRVNAAFMRDSIEDIELALGQLVNTTDTIRAELGLRWDVIDLPESAVEEVE
jgi:hypothetical protein